MFNTVSGTSYPLFPEAQCITTDGSWLSDGMKIVFSSSYPHFNETGVRRGDLYAICILDFKPEAYEKPTAVAVMLPSGFAVTGNYPNPFNPSTTIVQPV